MAKAYWVVCYRSISDPAARDAYTKLAVPAVLASGGQFLARGLPAKTYEGGINERTYWSSSTASTRRSLPMTAPTTKPHWLSLAVRWSVTSGSSEALMVEPRGCFFASTCGAGSRMLEVS